MTDEPWPELPWREWAPTVTSIHLWTQIVGKVRMALTPPLNHWWHATLYVTSRGLTTSPIPYQGREFQVDFDFVEHRLDLTDTDGGAFTMGLEPKSVAAFYRELMAGLAGLGIEVQISTRPQEIADAIPFDADEQHASYDPPHAQLLWRALLDADRVMKAFQTGFVGKASPVHLFWGGFDLATSRYSGRPAPPHPGGIPNLADWVNAEAFSREEVAIGWWPNSTAPGPAFYSYTYPEPAGFRAAQFRPAEAFFDEGFGELLLTNDALRASADPDAAVAEFFQSAYEVAADLGGWDRPLLEPQDLPDKPPRRSWSAIPE